MRVRKSVLILLVVSILLVSSFIVFKEERDVRYTDAELEEMSADDLYEVLTKNGLQVDENLKKILTEDQLVEYIKSDFHLLKNGGTSRNYSEYEKLADDIKNIYENNLRK
ncbi:hypothetical protein E4100_01320 [Soehngenia longivitae]|uniref:Uncharacterized protein n=1 Tax=Soehngenia longivitae TaxID=2562294 RepID=A0A4Z0DA98_9FIRM|nr:hypothetical protein [Soehngenia longivitae]TFZ41800.1 hypothetical protein E4100_01320 [Soehngenia longivitae]